MLPNRPLSVWPLLVVAHGGNGGQKDELLDGPGLLDRLESFLRPSDGRLAGWRDVNRRVRGGERNVNYFEDGFLSVCVACAQ